MNPHALDLIEFPRVLARVAHHAEGVGGREALLAAQPIEDVAAREAEIGRLAEAIRRTAEPGGWLSVAPHPVAARAADPTQVLDAEALLDAGHWLDAAAATRDAWTEAALAERHPRLAADVAALPVLEALRTRIHATLEPDGTIRDSASPALRRARSELRQGERDLESRLERWARPFGESAYVTRHGDRFVALVPAAGFSRSRGLVHDVSRTGQSLVVEPVEYYDANNRLIELSSTIRAEEQRVIRELAEGVRAAADDLATIERGLDRLDAHRARARWALEAGAIALAPGGEQLKLVRARHPLLALEAAVPLDLELERRGSLLLVSGPNMGGKTVLLKTVGLAVALAHAAFPVAAAEGSRLPEIDQIEVDLGDEQSLDRGLSTFAAHLEALDAMARAAGPRTLLLCDELGAGTDPEEGAPLGRALIEHFAARGAWGVLTTHLGALKRLAGTVAGLVNGSLEIDGATMTPTYRFVPGVPASHALAMAERLGFDRELVARARAYTREEAILLERVLQELQEQRRAMDRERAELAAARAEAEDAARRHRESEATARASLSETTRRLTRESDALLAQSRELWQSLQREARRADKSRTDVGALRERMQQVDREADTLRASGAAALGGTGAGPPPATFAAHEIVPGLRVRVNDLGLDAAVAEAPDAEGNVRLLRGSWSIQSHVSRLTRPAAAEANPPARGRAAAGAAKSSAPLATWEAGESAPLEVDLRGSDVDEALLALDHALDRAMLAGLGELRVIHGIGKGVLRTAVERHLREHPQVSSARMGLVNEGGRGVTVATLR